MSKKVVRLTESQLKQIVTESVKRLLRESNYQKFSQLDVAFQEQIKPFLIKKGREIAQVLDKALHKIPSDYMRPSGYPVRHSLEFYCNPTHNSYCHQFGISLDGYNIYGIHPEEVSDEFEKVEELCNDIMPYIIEEIIGVIDIDVCFRVKVESDESCVADCVYILFNDEWIFKEYINYKDGYGPNKIKY